MADVAIYFEILERVQEEIRKLALPRLPDEQVYLRPVIVDRNTTLPFVMVAPWGQEEEAGGTNERDNIIYPVAVVIVYNANQDLDINSMGMFLFWRERIARKFRNQRLLGMPIVYDCKVQPFAVVDPDLFLDKNLLVSGLLLKFTNRERRG